MRVIRHATLAINIDTTDSDSFEPIEGVFGMISVGSNFTGTTLTPMIKVGKDSTFRVVKDASGNTVTINFGTNRATRIPDSCFPCSSMKFVADENQGVNTELYVTVGS